MRRTEPAQSTPKPKASWLAAAEVLYRVFAEGMRVHEALRNRRDVRRMLDLDDRMLADIGLDRFAVQWALESRWFEDPSGELTRLARRSQVS